MTGHWIGIEERVIAPPARRDPHERKGQLLFFENFARHREGNHLESVDYKQTIEQSGQQKTGHGTAWPRKIVT